MSSSSLQVQLSKQRTKAYMDMKTDIDEKLKQKLLAFFSPNIVEGLLKDKWTICVAFKLWEAEHIQLRNAYVDVINNRRKRKANA